ncbi:outer membrane beta-barrel family protein [Mucilaginibacter lacusdianchii]|uniref:outer membrane beta-barrel family protein n=1 Tax=Mucilaginibacter lacusdianchii TaxID=2684211 RepID=UPI00131CBE5F|nr:outer membrane beta-barrel family protein [Mucilaginibacter sp. JXJ CY 39]
MRNFLYLAMFCLLSTICFVQNARAQITIKGTVIDSAKNTALSYGTVALRNANTNQPVKSTLSKDDGSFVFSGITRQPLQLVLASVGFQSKTITITDTTSAVINLGKLVLSAANNNLKEVAVTAVKPLIKQEVDRIGYDVQADPESKALNVLDMLRKVPLLSLDADDNIKMNGNSNYKILINGKPSSLVARSPKDVFRAMPASSIQKIEVITTPPAKYDSEGLAGIINIITNKKVDNGYNGSVNAGYAYPQKGLNLGGSFTVKQGKFGASTYFGSSVYDQPETRNSNSRVTTGQNASVLMQDGRQKYKSRFGYLGSELSYEIDTLNLITAEVNLNGNRGTNYNFRQSSLTIADMINQAYKINTDGKSNWSGYDLGINYQLGFKRNKSQLLTFSYKYSKNASTDISRLSIFDRIGYDDPNYNQDNKENSIEQTIQADYVHPLKKINIEAGIKAILRNNNSDFKYDTLVTNTADTYNTDASRSNTYQNYQYVLGAYNTYTYNFSTWAIKGGARLEETIIDADFMTSNSQFKKHYLNLIPSISINKRFKDMSSVNFGYTQRIQRPSIWQLNPFVDQSNPNFVSTGNPDLVPVVSNNLQFGYSKFKKGSFNIGLSYSFANNTVQQLSVYNTATGITTSTYDNIGKDKSLGTNININYPITKKWNYNLGGNMRYQWIQGIVGAEERKNKGVQGYFYTSTGYKFDSGWRFNASFSYNSPYLTLQGKSSSYNYSSFSVMKEIIKDKFSVSFVTSNPFTKYRNYTNTLSGDNFTQTTFAQNYFRNFRASLNYRFGKLQGEIKKNQRSINNDDKGSKS